MNHVSYVVPSIWAFLATIQQKLDAFQPFARKSDGFGAIWPQFGRCQVNGPFICLEAGYSTSDCKNSGVSWKRNKTCFEIIGDDELPDAAVESLARLLLAAVEGEQSTDSVEDVDSFLGRGFDVHQPTKS